MVGQLGLAGFHRPAGDEHRRDVEAQGGHQHAGGDLVAVGNAHQRVGAMRVDHVLDRVGDDLAAGQRVQHAVVAHRDTVVHGDGVELLGYAADTFDLTRHELPKILQVHMPRHELRERIGDGNDRLMEIAILHAGGAPECAGARHVAAVGGGLGAVFGHGGIDNVSERWLAIRPRQDCCCCNRRGAFRGCRTVARSCRVNGRPNVTAIGAMTSNVEHAIPLRQTVHPCAAIAQALATARERPRFRVANKT